MNINQQIDFMQAAANPFPLKASFHELEAGGYKCKMCGAKVKDQASATDHLLAEHREMEGYGTSEGVTKAWESRLHKTVTQHIKSGEFDADSSAEELHDLLRNAHPDAPKAAIAKVVNSIRPGRMEARDFSQGRRKKLAKSGKAMPGGGFPIVNREDLANAKRAIGRAKNPAAARRYINERAKALGAKPIGAQTEFSPDNRLRMPKKAGEGTTTQNPQYTGGFPELRAKKKKEMDAFGFKRHGGGMHRSGGGCSSHGFHRGAGYESKAGKMGHRLPLSAYGTSEGVKKAWESRPAGKKRVGESEIQDTPPVAPGSKNLRPYGSIARPFRAAAERPVLIQQRPIRRNRGVNDGFRGYQVIG